MPTWTLAVTLASAVQRHSILTGYDGVDAELQAGAGWQDPAVIQETGLCVWQSGPKPLLLTKRQPDELFGGRMALLWVGARERGTTAILTQPRNLAGIVEAGQIAELAVHESSLIGLCEAVRRSYALQRDEGMAALPLGGELAKKYCGSGHGGNAVYLFADVAARARFLENTPGTRAVEPYLCPAAAHPIARPIAASLPMRTSLALPQTDVYALHGKTRTDLAGPDDGRGSIAAQADTDAAKRKAA